MLLWFRTVTCFLFHSFLTFLHDNCALHYDHTIHTGFVNKNFPPFPDSLESSLFFFPFKKKRQKTKLSTQTLKSLYLYHYCHIVYIYDINLFREKVCALVKIYINKCPRKRGEKLSEKLKFSQPKEKKAKQQNCMEFTKPD